MTTISHSRMRRGGRKTFLLVLLLVVVLAAVLFWRAPLASTLWRVLAPVSHTKDTFFSGDSATLQAELASTTALVADRNALYQENIELKAMLGRSTGGHEVLAGVIARPPLLPYDTLMIDAGAAQGVEAGMFVSAGGTALIGTVEQAYATTARVVLFSAPGESYSALLTSSSTAAVPVTVVGQGGGSLMAQVPAQTLVVVGNSVVFPGVAGGFVGDISAVEAPTGSSFETLYVQLPTDPLMLRYVEVVTDSHVQ